MSLDWNDLLLSFLHDPPDKALDIRSHESRALIYAAAALSREVTRQELHGLDDQLAAIAERLPMPTAGPAGERGVSPDGGRVSVRHPISGQELLLEGCDLRLDETREVVSGLAQGIDDPRLRFLTLWRLLPERLAESCPWYARVPADTRVPDHTIWNHLDITAGMHAALHGAQGRAFLSLSIGPVQSFIASARSVRDLWTGSAILSWLTFHGLLPIIEELGPTAVVFPALRGTPLLDVWMRKIGANKVPEPPSIAKRTPCIPHRFLAIVPWGEGGSTALEIGKRCETSIRDKWTELTNAVRGELTKKLSAQFPLWDARWDAQVSSFFEVRVSVLPERDCTDAAMAGLFGKKSFADAQPNAMKVRSLADSLPSDDRPGYEQESSGRWQAQVEISARLMEAERMVRYVPVVNASVSRHEQYPPKCSLMGDYEQMGPANLKDSSDFWEKASQVATIRGVRLRSRERFCAIALAKRFAAPAFLWNELQIETEDLRFPDTATVAAAEWLKVSASEIDPEEVRQKEHPWSGQWLHWSRQDMEPDDRCPDAVWEMIGRARRRLAGENKPDRPPSYYAVLAMDGDSIGKWLRGENAPTVREVLHSKIRKYYEGLPKAEGGLDAKRPLGPALHMALSEALTNFAVRIAPRIVMRHHGTLIYSGGDDLLALLPTHTALACAEELQGAFRGVRAANNGADEGYYRLPEGRDLLVMGPKATVSAGLAVVHYKEDLREALRAARTAVHHAKDGGRDALFLVVRRRSGEHAGALCSWDAIQQVEQWVQSFTKGASDRWVYHLRSELPTLEGLPAEAIQAEIRRHIGRAEEETRKLLGGENGEQAGTLIAASFMKYLEMRAARIKEGATGRDSQGPNHRQGRFLADFVTLLQSASFLARGRES
jgi:CRISPR-associated protein Cmr2